MNTLMPLVPSQCDLTSYPYLPIEISTFLYSKEWIVLNESEKVAYINLILKSWHQVPAGSIPADDKILSYYAGVGKKWNKVKSKVLSSWVYATDDRFYHPYVAKRALEAWILKLNATIDANNGNAKRWNIVIDNSECYASLEHALKCLASLYPSSKVLEKNNSKMLNKSNSLLKSKADKSLGDRNINKRNQYKKNLTVNEAWNSSGMDGVGSKGVKEI